jgi:type IV pilus assembly protein PilB
VTEVGAQSRLGAALVTEGVLTPEQLEHLLAEQKTSGRMLGEMLVEQGVIDSTRMLRFLAQQLGVPFCQLRHGLVDFSLLALIGAEEAERLQAMPMFRIHDTLTVAMAEPQSLPKIDRLHQLTHCRIRPVLAPRANILEYIKKFASGNTDMDSFLASLSESEVAVVEKESVDAGPATNLDKMVEGTPEILNGVASNKGNRVRRLVHSTVRLPTRMVSGPPATARSARGGQDTSRKGVCSVRAGSRSLR